MPDARMDIIKENGMQPITINEAMKMFSESLCLNESVIGLIGVTDRTKARKFFHIDQPVTIQMDNLDSKDLDELLSDWLSKKDSMTEHEQIEMKESAVRLLTRFDVDLLSNSVVKKVYSLMFADEVQPKMNVSPIKNDQYKHNKDDEVDIRSIVFETIKKALLVDDLVLNEKLQHYGMDSVSAMQISSRLSNRLGVSIEPIWLLDNPTIDLFSNYLESKFEDLTLKSEIRTN
jgi:acyl carrier protein